MSAQPVAGKQNIWLRCETKELERRAALTPTTAKALLDTGKFAIFVERDPQRIFNDEEYEAVGCKLVPHSSWPSAPLEIPILGLKELPTETTPLPHTHIQFAHCFKNQGGWTDVILRYARGNGRLYDLEFLQDETGRRVAAFGFHAGFAGAAIGALALAAQFEDKKVGSLEPYDYEADLVKEVKASVDKARAKLGRNPRALVIGALGRCGKGAVSLFEKAGLNDEDILKWDMAETAKGGPFQEILDVEIFVNCIYLSQPIPKFVTKETITAAGPSRALRVVVDVSCDTTNPHNPLPVYDINTTFSKPTVPVELDSSLPPVDVCSIDHLPSLLPREASESFSEALLPSLKTLVDRESAPVWVGADKLYREKVADAEAAVKKA